MNTQPGLIDLNRYLAMPAAQRPLAQYRQGLLDPVVAFSPAEVSRLAEIVSLGEVEYPKTRVSKLLIDLSWASSRLEGNTYTQLDTQTLVEYGQRNPDKPAEDAVMILNHKRAIEFMLKQQAVDEKTIRHIHALLADDTQARDSRHFLPVEQCGALRAYTPHGLEIDGSSYIPPQEEDRGPGFIKGEFSRLVEAIRRLPDPVNQSFHLMTRLPYLQPFYDANKRTARIVCNIPLISHGLAPLSFVDFDKTRYIGGLLAFYELGDVRLAKQAYLEAYLASALRYRPFRESERVSLASDMDRHVKDAVRYVMEGIREPSPPWLGARATEKPTGIEASQTEWDRKRGKDTGIER